MPEIAVLIAVNVFLIGVLIVLHLEEPTHYFTKPHKGFWLRALPVWFTLFSAVVIIVFVFWENFFERILLK